MSKQRALEVIQTKILLDEFLHSDEIEALKVAVQLLYDAIQKEDDLR